MNTPRTIDLPDQVTVVNIGLSGFADAVRQQGRTVTQVDWRVPAGGDRDLVRDLRRVYGSAGPAIAEANAEVLRRLDTGVPRLVAVHPLADVAPELPPTEAMPILHCGPPIAWTAMCDPLRRSVRAAVVAEGWAEDIDGAGRLLHGGRITLLPAGEHATVVPMATAIGPSVPVFVVENTTGETRAFAPINQGPGEVAWFGVDTDAAVGRLRFLRDVVGPALGRMIDRHGPLDVLYLAAQGVQAGDDVHLRSQGSTNLLVRILLPELARLPDGQREELAGFLSGNHLFFLNLAMAAAKSLTLWAERVPGSSIVTTMARNGTTFGIKLAGSPRWHVADAPPVEDALFQPGYGADAAAPDIGDSAVLELIGLGGAAAAGAPAVAAFVGGSMRYAAEVTERMRQICVSESSRFTLPTFDFRGTPLGVDVRRVVELSSTPKISTGILDARCGGGQIGAGVATAPIECFTSALADLARRSARDGSNDRTDQPR
jgi:uncharacterized protein DUF1116